MAKYYVKSGDYRRVIQADSARDAALWAVHMAMESTVPLDDLQWLSERTETLHAKDDATKLGKEVSLSEIGFERNDAGRFDTLDVMTEWNQLTAVVARLSEVIDLD